MQSCGARVNRDTNRTGEWRWVYIGEKDKCCLKSRCSQKSCVFKSFLKEESRPWTLFHYWEIRHQLVWIDVPVQTALPDNAHAQWMEADVLEVRGGRSIWYSVGQLQVARSCISIREHPLEGHCSSQCKRSAGLAPAAGWRPGLGMAQCF